MGLIQRPVVRWPGVVGVGSRQAGTLGIEAVVEEVAGAQFVIGGDGLVQFGDYLVIPRRQGQIDNVGISRPGGQRKEGSRKSLRHGIEQSSGNNMARESRTREIGRRHRARRCNGYWLSGDL